MESTVKDNFESHLYFKRTKHFSKKHAFLEVIKCNVTKFKIRNIPFCQEMSWLSINLLDFDRFFYYFLKFTPIRDPNLSTAKVVTFLYAVGHMWQEEKNHNVVLDSSGWEKTNVLLWNTMLLKAFF